MALAKSDVVIIAPELAAVADGDFASVIVDVALQLDPKAWGALRDLGAKYLVAHTLAVAHPELYRPLVTRDRVGEVETNYAVSTSGTDELDATKYGREHKRLRRQLGLVAFVL